MTRKTAPLTHAVRLSVTDATTCCGGEPMNHHFGIMARYNAWANSRLYAEACSLSVEIYPKNVCAFFGSLHGTLNHLLVTDRIWMHRFTGEGEHPAQLNAIMFNELLSLEVHVEPKMLGSSSSGRSFRGRDWQGFQLLDHQGGCHNDSCYGILLAHWFNHQTHYRGQEHCILTVLGFPEPKSLDFLAMYCKVTSGHQAPVPNFRSDGLAASIMR